MGSCEVFSNFCIIYFLTVDFAKKALFNQTVQDDRKYNISFERKFMVSGVAFLLISTLPSVSSYASNLRFKPSNPTKMTKNFFDLHDPTHFKR